MLLECPNEGEQTQSTMDKNPKIVKAEEVQTHLPGDVTVLMRLCQAVAKNPLQ